MRQKPSSSRKRLSSSLSALFAEPYLALLSQLSQEMRVLSLYPADRRLDTQPPQRPEALHVVGWPAVPRMVSRYLTLSPIPSVYPIATSLSARIGLKYNTKRG